MFNDTFYALSTSAHGVAVHFPIALLIVSIVMDVLANRRPALRQTAWYLLLIGTLGAVLATITGLIAHLPYEESQYTGAIERHQYTAFATTAVFVALAAWRWRSARRDDLPSSAVYVGVSLLGLAVLVVTGYLGGQLVYELGVGVNGVSR